MMFAVDCDWVVRVSEARDISAVFQRSKNVLFEVPQATHARTPSYGTVDTYSTEYGQTDETI